MFKFINTHRSWYQVGRTLETPDSLAQYIDEVTGAFDTISNQRQEVLDGIAKAIRQQTAANSVAQLTFICTHNSRRSHFAQVWSEIAARYYGVLNVKTWSGGTETTACNIRTIEALCRAGLILVSTSKDENPVFNLQYSESQPTIQCYSKIYTEPPNPQEDFIGILCCSDVDDRCPAIVGADIRVSLHYIDPKHADETEQESNVYDQRCRQIAAEMFYLMSITKYGNTKNCFG